MFAVIAGAQYLGQAVPNIQEIPVAQGAASALYDIIDRVRMFCLLTTS